MQYRKITTKNTSSKSSANSLLDELLALKNITNEAQKERFLNPSKNDFISPFAFCDMKKALDRINLAIEKQEKILIWGDFDCDGVTSTSILYKTLKELKANVTYFIPDRLLHGHGLNSKELIKLISKEKVKLVITVDCGSSNVSEVRLLKGLKVDTIITDHHTIDTQAPDCFAIINPQVKNAIDEKINVEDITSLSHNCGAGIAYKLAIALLKDNNNINLKEELLVIAACGTIADVVPLLGENRSIVKVALDLLNTKGYQTNKGIYSLLKNNLGEKLITSYDIAFILAPRINAVGRLANAKLSFEFLTTDNDLTLEGIMQQLDNYNKIRQSKCQETYEEIISYLEKNKEEQNKPAIILLNKDWHIGIIGIVASKIVEQFNKPCFLMTQDENNNARCSIRSNELINVYGVLKENEDLFSGFGGHALAGGCSFNLTQKSFDEVKNQLLKTVKESQNRENKQDFSVLQSDFSLEPDEITFELIEEINKLEPFGQNNSQPIFSMYGVNLDEFKLIGKEQNHLSAVVSKDNQKFRCLKWQEGLLKLPLNSTCDIAFYLRENEFNNEKTIQFELLDIYCPDFIINSPKKEYKIFDHRQKRGILEQISNYVEKDLNFEIGIWAKTSKTKEILSKFDNIKARFIDDFSSKKALMFFDYPSSLEEMEMILKEISPKKIHFMNNIINGNVEDYVKQLAGMVKYCHFKLDGKIDVFRMALALGMSESFIHISLEILEDISSIKILDVDKISYIKPFSYEDFKNSSMYEVLIEEFDKIIEFKNNLLNINTQELEKTILNILE